MSVRYSILPDMQFLKYFLFFFMIMVGFFVSILSVRLLLGKRPNWVRNYGI